MEHLLGSPRDRVPCAFRPRGLVWGLFFLVVLCVFERDCLLLPVLCVFVVVSCALQGVATQYGCD